uniref:KRAB domain-containing protein n=1 Tax=Amazona collaria TaxID=241587 RepID=A0A8B9EYW6_9PSIT
MAPALCSQGPVTFEDIVVRFSGAEWASLDDGQRELYRTVMEDNYEMLVSLCREELLPRISSQSPLCQVKAIPPCPVPTCPCQKPLSSFLIGPFWHWKLL